MRHRSARNGRSQTTPSKGNRFTAAQHAEALKLVASGMTRVEAAASIGCSTESLRRWTKMAKPIEQPANGANRHGATGVSKTAPMEPPAAVAPAAPSSAPHDPGSGLGEHETKAILDYKRKHPSMGPAQIRAQLKRFLGWRVSVRAIARVLHKAGFPKVHRKGRPVGDEHPGSFEAPHRNSLWQLDFKDLRVGAEKRWLLVIEDDFSRFIVGHVLADGPTSEVVVAALREAIRLHGKPERVYTDRAAAFTAWRDVTACEVFLDEQLIDHSLRGAHRPQGGGKIESVVDTVQRELWEIVHFDSVADAERALARFFVEYNHRRAHMGIGSLVPADRFFGRWPEVVAEMDAVSRRRQGALALKLDRRLFIEAPAAAERALALQLVLVGDQAELHVFGRRVILGRVEP
jgi:transposase InsO family protein